MVRSTHLARTGARKRAGTLTGARARVSASFTAVTVTATLEATGNKFTTVTDAGDQPASAPGAASNYVRVSAAA